MKVYINGNYFEKDQAKISVFDHGLLYGDGVFEGIRIYEGRIFKLDEHLKRLEESAKAVFIALPLPLAEIRTAIIETVRKNELHNGYMRVVITRGPGDLGLDMRKCREGSTLIIIADHITLYPATFYENGLTVVTASVRQRAPDQLAPNIKSLNYLANVLAHADASRAGAQEALLLTHEGYVSECSADNIFYVYEGNIYTPPAHVGILEGITRRVAMDLARDVLDNPVIESLFTPFELYRADEVFLTGTGAEIIGVVKIDGRTIGAGVPGPVTKNLVAAFKEYVRSTGVPI